MEKKFDTILLFFYCKSMTNHRKFITFCFYVTNVTRNRLRPAGFSSGDRSLQRLKNRIQLGRTLLQLRIASVIQKGRGRFCRALCFCILLIVLSGSPPLSSYAKMGFKDSARASF